MSTKLLSSPSLASAGRRSPFARLVMMAGVHRERQALDSLDAHLLQDIGVSREEAHAEATRSPWDLPDLRIR